MPQQELKFITTEDGGVELVHQSSNQMHLHQQQQQQQPLHHEQHMLGGSGGGGGDITNDQGNTMDDDIDNNPLSEFIVLKTDASPMKVEIDCNTLIDAIRSRSLLYDRTHKQYTNTRTRDEAWLQVASVCGCTTSAVKSKWKFLRTKYISESKSKTESKWQYWEQMHFIKGHLNSAVVVRQQQGLIVRSNDVDLVGGGPGANDSDFSHTTTDLSALQPQGDEMAIDDARLVALIRENLILYDRSHEYYNNPSRKDEIWMSLANVLHSRGKSN